MSSSYLSGGLTLHFTLAQLKTAVAPRMAATGRNLDVTAMKVAQAPVNPSVQKAEPATPADPGARAVREEKAFDHLIRPAKRHGGKIGANTEAEIEAGRHPARADRAHEAEHGFRSLVRKNEGTDEAVRAKAVPSEPILEHRDGKLRLRAFAIEHGGITPYRAYGRLEFGRLS